MKWPTWHDVTCLTVSGHRAKGLWGQTNVGNTLLCNRNANKFFLSFQVIPMVRPLKTELKVDACVLVPVPNNIDSYISGRIHEVKDNVYDIERLIDVRHNSEKMQYKMRELVVVYSAWCSKCYLRSFISSFHLRLLHWFGASLCTQTWTMVGECKKTVSEMIPKFLSNVWRILTSRV